MSKKFTIVVVLAALLLAIPSHAQVVARKKATNDQIATNQHLTLEASKIVKASMAKAEDKTMGIAFRGGKVRVEQNENVCAQNQTKEQEKISPIGEKLLLSRPAETWTPYVYKENSPLKTFRASGEITDGHGIILSPAEGVEHIYSRAGKAYFVSGGSMYGGNQSGLVTVVECPDGTIYVKNPISRYSTGAWVKGVKTGNTITIPTCQPLYCYSNGVTEETTSLRWGAIDENGQLSSADEHADAFTFVINNDVISLQGTSAWTNGNVAYYMAAIWDEDNLATGYGDAETTWTKLNVVSQIDVLPYTPSFSDIEIQASYTIVDGNNDNMTWGFADGNAHYLYSATNAADDWLITPAIKLQAGHLYRFSIDTWAASSTYHERVEVKMGTEKEISALTRNVIPSTDITWSSDDVRTLENGTITVETDGYYFFGVHVISDANKYELYVNNLIVEVAAGENAPSAVTEFEVVPEEEKLEATISFKAPSKTVVGTELDDLTEIDILRDGKVIKILRANNIEWTASEQDYVNEQNITRIDFGGGVIATFDRGDNNNAPTYYDSGTSIRMYANNTLTLHGSDIKKVIFTLTGSDNQKQLAVDKGDYALSGNIGTWTGLADEIVFSVPSGQARIQKIVIETGEVLVPGARYSFVDNDPALTIGTHVYQVIPYNTSGTGVKSEEKPVFLSTVMDVPLLIDFSHVGTIEQFQVVDANGDDSTWEWNADYGAYYGYNQTNSADDYLVSLPIHLEAGVNYTVIVNANAANIIYSERFEVKLGKAPTADELNTTILEATEVTSMEEIDFENDFTVSESGNYYIAIHAISDANRMRLSINRLIIEKSAEPFAPGAITNFIAKAGAKGALEVNLSFVTPETYCNGTPAEGVMDVDIYRDMELKTTLKNVPYGCAQSWKDTDVEDGILYTYLVMPANASGPGLRTDHISVFVGHDTPAKVEGLTAIDKVSLITLGWQKVGEEGANGGYVDPTKVDYQVWTLKSIETIYGRYLDFDEKLSILTDANSYDVAINTDEGDQRYKYWGVRPINERGNGELAVIPTLVGAAYELPIMESFEDKMFHYIWEYSENGNVFVSTESSDEDGVAIGLAALNVPGSIKFHSGKINLKNISNPMILFDVKSATITNLNLIGSVNGAEFTNICSNIPVTPEYTTVKIPLDDIKEGRYSQVGISADFANITTSDVDGDLLFIDNIRIVDYYEHDLSVNIVAPTKVFAGQKATLKATIKNEGGNAAEGYTLKIKAGEKELLKTTADEILLPFKSAEYIVDLETSIFDEAGDIFIAAEVVYANDLNETNNTAETAIIVNHSDALSPQNLTAEDRGEAGVVLAWDTPVTETRVAEETVTEGFENGLGDFTTIDADLDGYNWKHHVNMNLEGEYQYAVHAGSGCVYSESFNNGFGALFPDNWLITPYAKLGGEFKFWACGQDAGYAAEHFAVFVSTTSAVDLESFVKVSDEFVTTSEMTEYTVDLSEFVGQNGYIAIRHYNITDMFALVIDDVTYVPAIYSAAPVAYNIYYDREKIASVEGDKTTYTVAAEKIEAGEHTFGVSAVYANGQESMPAIVEITITTDIRQIISDGKPVDVYSLDGKLVRSQVKSLNGLKGVYVINGKTILVK